MKYRAVFFGIFLGLLFLLPIEQYHVSAPELFGDGTMLALQTKGTLAGLIQGWGVWAIYSTEDRCEIIALSRTVGDASGPIACFMDFRSESKFVGWIDFRGHRRKFCGATRSDNLPVKCYGE